LKRIWKFESSLAVSVALITFAVYLPSLQNGFINWDDTAYVTENVQIRSFDWAFLRWIFFDFHAAYWHPLTWTSHALDYAIWGLNPFGHHLTNNILHAINSCLAVVLIITVMKIRSRRTSEKERSGFLTQRTIWITGAVTGLLFGLHPLHVESAVWVAERKDLLCALFFLLTLLMYVKYADSKSSNPVERTWFSPFSDRRYLVAVFFFVLAISSKPMAVSLPIVLLLVDWYLFRSINSFRSFLSAIVEKIPFIVLSLFISVVIFVAQKTGGAVMALNDISFSTRLLVAAKSLIAYLRMMIWPEKLFPYYPHPFQVSPLSPGYFSAVILVIAITSASIALIKKQKLFAVIWGYYVITLLPVLGLVQVGPQELADRFTYLPSLGPFLLMGLATAWVLKKTDVLKKGRAFIQAFFAAAVVALLITLSLLTFKQIALWKNCIVLWNYVIDEGQVTSYIAYNNRGVCLENAGLVDAAAEDYRNALALNPRDDQAYFNMGNIFYKTGLIDQAIDFYSRSIDINANRASAYYNRAIAYSIKNQPNKALEDFDRAIDLKQGLDMTYFGRGKFFSQTGQTAAAIADYEKACSLGNQAACQELVPDGHL
jgi:tetratricopeptide (TPR) repeat protein